MSDLWCALVFLSFMALLAWCRWLNYKEDTR